MKGKETFLYIVIVPVLIVAAIIIGVLLEVDIKFLLILALIMIIIYLIGLYALFYIDRMIRKTRAYIEDDEQISDEIYLEGELGKLLKSTDDLKRRLSDSEAEKLKEKEFLRDIISDISHQIKTPVASLTVFNDILLEEIDDVHKPMIEQSGIQIERIKWLVLSMLQLARIEASSIEFDIQSVGFLEVVDSCLDILSIKAKEKNINFVLDVKDETIAVDTEWFKEALINIIKNAIEYSPADSEIQISISKTPLETRIYVKDYGMGIPESERLNIFKRFYTVHGNQVNPNSVGIGLALSKSIIEGMGGRIWVESRYKDEIGADEASFTKMVISLDSNCYGVIKENVS